MAEWSPMPLDALRDDRLTRNDLRALAVVLYRCGPEGCWASVGTLAEQISMPHRSMRRCLQRLVMFGWLAKTGHKTIRFGQVVIYNPGSRVTGGSVPSGGSALTGVTSDRGGQGATIGGVTGRTEGGSPVTPNKNSKQNSDKNTSTPTPSPLGKLQDRAIEAAAEAGKLRDNNRDEVIGLWNSAVAERKENSAREGLACRSRPCPIMPPGPLAATLDRAITEWGIDVWRDALSAYRVWHPIKADRCKVWLITDLMRSTSTRAEPYLYRLATEDPSLFSGWNIHEGRA